MVRKLFFFVCAVMYIVSAMTANAAPLPNGTILKITPGVGSGVNTPCIVGSCFVSEEALGFRDWTDLQPGTDGGFIVGKFQASGGQELASSTHSNSTPGELTAATLGLLFSGVYGTLYTPPGGPLNVFDDASCTKAACIGKTALNTFNIAWNGVSFPIGSSAGCFQPGCTPDQLAGIFVNSYTIDLVGKTWSMEYSQVISSGGFDGMSTHAIFRGTVVLPSNCPIVDYAWQSPGSQLLLVFGSQLKGVTGVMIDGVNAPLFQEVDGSVLLVLSPPGVTQPWKPGTVQVTANGCSGSFPRPCGT